MFVLILCMYKVGSCFLEQCLRDNSIRHIKLHSYDIDEQNEYPMDDITHVITIKRDPQKVYMSAFFEDISKINVYPYAYGTSDQVEKASIQDLINHYNAQEWEKYRWLNFDYYEKWIEIFKQHNKKTLILDCDSLSEEVNQKLPTFLGVTMNLNLKPSHLGKNGEYGNRYETFKKIVLSANGQ